MDTAGHSAEKRKGLRSEPEMTSDQLAGREKDALGIQSKGGFRSISGELKATSSRQVQPKASSFSERVPPASGAAKKRPKTGLLVSRSPSAN